MNKNNEIERLTGMIVPLITPFNADESINYPVLERLINFLVKSEIHGILLGGSTGEYSLMSMDERKSIIDFGSKIINNRTKVIAGCSCYRPKDTLEMISFAESAGAKYGLVLPPYYMQTTDEGILAYYKELAASTKMGIIIYHYPQATGVRLGPELVFQLAKINNIVGIKDTDTMANTAKLIDITKGIDNFSVINGEEYNILGTLAMGGDGCMGILFNLVPEEMVALYEAVISNDIRKAKEIYIKLLPLYGVMEEEPYPGPIKAALELKGFSVGIPRKPITQASSHMHEKIKKMLYETGVL